MSIAEPQPRDGAAYHHGDLKQALIDAALIVLAKTGPSDIGLRELARTVGVSPAAPYRHFKSRDALLAAVSAHGFDVFTARLNDAVRGIPARHHLAVLGMAYVQFARANKPLFQLMFSPDLDKSSYPDLARASEAAFALLAEAAGAEVPEKKQEAALGAWALVHGLAQLIIDGQFPPMGENESRALIASILKRSIDGMRALRPTQPVAQ